MASAASVDAMDVRLTNTMLSQIYFKMSDIQNSNRRVVLVHTDESILIRVMESAHRLKLFDKKRYWFLMDGLIGHRLASPEFASRLSLPVGLMALHQRPVVQQSSILYAIIHLLRDLAINVSIPETEARLSCADARVSQSRRDLSHRLFRSDTLHHFLSSLFIMPFIPVLIPSLCHSLMHTASPCACTSI